MGEMINITVYGEQVSVEKGVKLADIADDKNICKEKYPVMLCRVNGVLRELHNTVKDGDTVTFVTPTESAGKKAYQRGVTLLFLKSLYKVVGSKNIRKCTLEYGLGKATYISVSGFEVTDELCTAIKEHMQELVSLRLPIIKKTVSTTYARELFKKLNMHDKEKLFKFRRESNTNLYYLGDFVDYFYGYMPDNIGKLSVFDVRKFKDGIFLCFPDRKDPTVLGEVYDAEKLFNTLDESGKWADSMGISTVGDLNEFITYGNASDLIMLSEALQEKKMAEIAEMVKEAGDKRFIMIAGPSSSGKTTFSHRLSIHLRLVGFKPHPIGLDNFYKNRSECPRDEDGNYDFECLEALDVKLFNDCMTRLLNGEKVEMPTFNFKTGAREYKGDFLKLGENDILVIEGIHGINDELSYSLPPKYKFKIYISALTQINIDEHNRIPTTDCRLLRRIIRDARTRGTSAGDTIAMWPSVRRGEEQYIFPFQENADVMFNSALLYELPVIKSFAEPLLFGIDENSKEFEKAKSLLKFLSYFQSINTEDIPKHSIVREFIGGSYFNV